jgi:hypothetical protein
MNKIRKKRTEGEKAHVRTLFVTGQSACALFKSWALKLRVIQRLIPSGSSIFLLQIANKNGIRNHDM